MAPSDAPAAETRGRAADILTRLRALSFEEDRAAAAGEMARLLAEALQQPGLEQESAIRLSAYAHVVAHDRTGALDPGAMANAPMRAIIQVNELLRLSSRADVAAVAVRAYHQMWPGHEGLAKTARMTSGHGIPDNLLRDDPEADLQIVRRPGATSTLMVFCGVNHGFGIAVGLLYNFWLTGLDANIIVLRDFENTLYLGGLRSIGSLDATLARLKQEIAGLGASRLATIGFSSGNFGALFYGARLGADHVVAFAGPTSIDIGLRFPNKQTFPRIKALQDEGRLINPDLRAEVAAAAGMQVECFHSEGNRADKMQAENLVGLANVSVTPLAGSDAHFTLDQLAEEGRLSDVFKRAVGLA